MNTSTSSKPHSADDEIDLIPLLLALWNSKKIILAATLAGAALSYVLHTLSPEQWTASTYIAKSSLYNLYKEVKNEDATAPATPPPQEIDLYSSIQNDVFFTAMGVMAANAISLKESAPKTGRNESVLYIASATATTKERALDQLKSALDAANTEAIALNLPTLAPANNVRAFNTLDDVKTTNSKHPKKLVLLGSFLGLILSSLFVIIRFMKLQYKHTRQP